MTRNTITKIEGEFENGQMNGDVTSWDVGAKRWTKGGKDRLYFNDTDFVDYVNLESLYVASDHAQVSESDKSARIEGDTLIVEVVAEGVHTHKKMKAVFQLGDDLAEETEDDDDDDDEETQTEGEAALQNLLDSVDTDDEDDTKEDETPVITDGGEDVSEEFTDNEIQAAIDSNAAETTTEEVRDVLAMVQRSVEEVWDIHMDNVEDNAMELVSIDGDTLVFADHTGQFWNSEFDNGPVGDADLGHGVQNVVTQLHHEWAERHTDYSWSVDDPVVVRKPAGFDAGQRLVESVVVGLIERGLTPRQAWSVWGVLAGNSRNNWATRMGYDSHSGVSNAVREAKEKIPLNYL